MVLVNQHYMKLFVYIYRTLQITKDSQLLSLIIIIMANTTIIINFNNIIISLKELLKKLLIKITECSLSSSSKL